MDESCSLLAASMTRILEDREAGAGFVAGADDVAASRQFEALGLPLALVSEDAGGYGLPPADLLAALRVLGRFTALLPTADQVHAAWLGAMIGTAEPPAAAAPVASVAALVERDDGWSFAGTLHRVPWREGARTVVCAVPAPGGDAALLLCLPCADASIAVEHTLAGDVRATLTFDAVVPASAVAPLACGLDGYAAAGAAIRCQLIAGAAARVLEMTVRYVGERKQFGRAIGQFQAVQQQLAVMAGEVAAAQAGADAAAEGFGSMPDIAAIAGGKVRCGEAAGRIAAIAHQVHGAIGYAGEHALHRLTRQLWTWRDEWGGEARWAGWLGRFALAGGAGGLWPLLAPTGEAIHA